MHVESTTMHLYPLTYLPDYLPTHTDGAGKLLNMQ